MRTEVILPYTIIPFSFASSLSENGYDIRTVKELLGKKDAHNKDDNALDQSRRYESEKPSRSLLSYTNNLLPYELKERCRNCRKTKRYTTGLKIQCQCCTFVTKLLYSF